MLNSGDEIGGELLSLRMAAENSGVSSSYLRFLIFKKKLRGIKIGKVWFTKPEWIKERLSVGRNVVASPHLSGGYNPASSSAEAMSHLPVIREAHESGVDYKKSYIAEPSTFKLKVAPDGTMSLPRIVIKEIVIEGTTFKGQIVIEPEAI